MGKKGNLSDFERGTFVSARWAGMGSSETIDLLGFLHRTLGFTLPGLASLEFIRDILSL